MPDETIYGFNKHDTIELLNLIGNQDVEFPEVVPRDLGGVVGGVYQGEVQSIDDGTGEYTGVVVAQVLVKFVVCGQTSLLGTTVSVVDWSGCILDDTEENLTDVWVWFTRGQALSADPEASEGAVTPCHYATVNRCCI